MEGLMQFSNLHSAPRRAYSTPVLKRFGAVSALTAAGSGPTTEQNNGMAGCSQNTSASACTPLRRVR
jgi:hypothetical protein